MHSIQITSAYAALLGVMLVFAVLRVVTGRKSKKVSLGDGDDKELGRLIRGHGNFVETVPMALILMLILELQGSSAIVLHCLGIALLVGRILHYIRITSIVKINSFRFFGMVLTLTSILAASILLFIGSIS